MSPAQGFWQGAERATGRALDTAVNVGMGVRREAMAYEGLKIQRSQEARAEELGGLTKRKAELDIAQTEAENKLQPISKIFERIGVNRPEVQQYLIKYAGPRIQTGPASGLPSITPKHAREVWDAFQKDPNAIMTSAKIRAQAASRELTAITNDEIKLKPDEKKARIATLNDEIELMDNSVKRLLKAEKTLEQVEAEAKARATGTAAGTPPKTPIDQAIRTFEIQHYGKLVPQLRGTPAYIKKLTEAKKAGAMNINIAGEKFDIQKQATSGELRTGLTTNKDDKNYYEANADVFNSINKKNEVAYWDKGEGRFYDEESKIIKLSPSAIAAGWTPKKIQDAANAKAKTVQEVLRDIGLIK